MGAMGQRLATPDKRQNPNPPRHSRVRSVDCFIASLIVKAKEKPTGMLLKNEFLALHYPKALTGNDTRGMGDFLCDSTVSHTKTDDVPRKTKGPPKGGPHGMVVAGLVQTSDLIQHMGV